jgi:hypothetical protein
LRIIRKYCDQKLNPASLNNLKTEKVKGVS